MLEKIPRLTYVATAFLTTTMQGTTEVSTVRRFTKYYSCTCRLVYTQAVTVCITRCISDVDSETFLT